MDSLDFNLHQAILKSLATSYACSDIKSSKATATGKEPAEGTLATTQCSFDEILETFGVMPDLLDDSQGGSASNRTSRRWSLADANAVIALAEYAIESARNATDLQAEPLVSGNQAIQQEMDDRLANCAGYMRQLLLRLPTINVERCLGAQGMSSKWVISDQLACSLATAAITLATAAEDDGLFEAVLKAYVALKAQLEGDEVSGIVEHVLPAINGVHRAITSTKAIWRVSALSPLVEAVEVLSPAAASTISSISRGSFIHSSEEGRFVLSVLSRYDSIGTPLSMNFVSMCDSAICASILGNLAGGSLLAPHQSWEKLVSGTIKSSLTLPDGLPALQQLVKYSKRALEESLETLREIEDNEDSVIEGTDLYELHVVANSLKTSTAACLAHTHEPEHVATLETILSDNSPIYDTSIQITALECLQALVHAYADLAAPTLDLLRRFVTSPLPILNIDEDDATPSPVLEKAAAALSTSIERLNQADITLSTVYSFLNYLPSSRTEHLSATVRSNLPSLDGNRLHASMANRSPRDRRQISANTLFVVTKLATRFKQQDMVKLALSMMLQRIRNSDVVSERAALHCVADLAPEASKEDFEDAVRALTDFSRESGIGLAAGYISIVQDASLRLASNLAHKPQYAQMYLRELLVLFTDQTAPMKHTQHRDGHIKEKLPHSPAPDRSASLKQLLDTLSVIQTVLSADALKPQEPPYNEELVVLFRNLWFISTVLGLTSSRDPETRKHSELLRSIAYKTPCLVHGTPANYVETELEYNPFIRKEHGTSSEALRDELAGFVQQHQSITARNLTYPQVIFLLSVVKLESMRAELGGPSTILQYFQNDGINRGPLSGPLDDVSAKVTEAFVASFDHKVRRHAVKRSIARDLKSMVLVCCGMSSKARKAAFRSLDTIFGQFPVLLCDGNLLTAILECLTLLRNACESEMDNEYDSTFEYKSEAADITLILPDDYGIRNEILTTFHQYSRAWLLAALAASPLEMSGLLQEYLDADAISELTDNSGMGKSVALDVAKSMPLSIREAGFPHYGGWKADAASLFASAFGTRHTYGSEAKTVVGLARNDGLLDKLHVQKLRQQLRKVSDDLRYRRQKWDLAELRPMLYRAAAVVIAKKELDYGLIREIVFIPVHAIQPPALHLGVEVWAWLVDKRADVETKLMVDVHLAWQWTIRRRRGMFSVLLKAENPITSKTEYSPTDIPAIKKADRTVKRILAPHRYLIEFLSSRFQAYRYRDRYLVLNCMRLVLRACERCGTWGKHPLVRELRMKILTLGFSILNCTHLEQSLECKFRDALYKASLSWFEETPTWSYGSDRLQLMEDIKAMNRLITVANHDHHYPCSVLSTKPGQTQYQPSGPHTISEKHREQRRLLILHLDSEIQRLSVWTNPLEDPRKVPDPVGGIIKQMSPHQWVISVRSAWAHSPRLAVLMAQRFKDSTVTTEVSRLVHADPGRAAEAPEALDYFIGSGVQASTRSALKHLCYWAAVSPIAALKFFLPGYNKEPLIIQYAMRTLEQHPIDLVFFYVPQVVQALRTDPLNYMERFIFETSKISQLFCHQMIWNMKANCFRDDLAEVADPDKAKFERMEDLIVGSLSGEAKAFYEKEFGFFNEVTSISRKLMPFVKKTKPEKKAKIDEEMAKIKVEEGVYLPSHPEGRVVDIDRHSGRPLQSHAKTPFMATFMVTREFEEEYSATAIENAGGEQTTEDGRDGGAKEGFPSLQGVETSKPSTRTEETKLSAIFKVGDDCRQDVLALQVIAQFKNMFNVCGLDLQVQPYKVLATGPGTGIIDVVPNATSRDEMGRAKINDLTEFFKFQFGALETVDFQRARNNFIQSMAAYSVLCYILQIKDRHNGNIMIDGEGRITHIDFGFLFDIGPGGIKFEPNSFKLTHEMLTLMGGKISQGYRQFRELTVKAFLASRPFAEDVVATCSLMMPTQLPSFKGEGTIHRLRDRFKPELTEREAARYMIGVIDNACENSMSIVYDQFQYYQNRIPYAS